MPNARPTPVPAGPIVAQPAGPYPPLVVEGQRAERLSRWQWLVKWLLLLPHHLILILLWIPFCALTVIAALAILITGRYPRKVFDFNVGVLRWTWRVNFYGYQALATDRYPPFSLKARDDYPATLEVEYPQHLSRKLVLFKPWLFAIPQYLALVFIEGLICVLVLLTALLLPLAGGSSPNIFSLTMGLNRWTMRVAVYAALMTDRYPPFRIDQGSTDQAEPVIVTFVEATHRSGSPGIVALLVIRIGTGLAVLVISVLGWTEFGWPSELNVAVDILGMFIIIQTLGSYLWFSLPVRPSPHTTHDESPSSGGTRALTDIPTSAASNSYADAAKLAITTQGIVLGLISFSITSSWNLVTKVGAASLAAGVLIASVMYLLVAQVPPPDPPRRFVASLLLSFLLWALGFGLICVVAGGFIKK